MKIKSKLLTITVLPLVVLLITSVIIIALSRDMERAHAREDMGDAVADMTSDLIILTYEYGVSAGDRPRIQWTGQHAAITSYINTMLQHFVRTEARSLLNDLNRIYKTADGLFNRLCEYDRGRMAAEWSPSTSEFRNNLVNRLILELRTTAPIIDGLEKISHEDQDNNSRRRNLLVIVLMVFLVAIISPLSYFIVKGITRSLAIFQKGILAVASGDLEHQIRMGSRDEIGALAHGFDEMTQRLRLATVSRDELAKEVNERRMAEDESRTIIRTALDGFLVTDTMGKILDVNDSYCKLLQYDREEMLRMRVQDVEAIDSPEVIQQNLARMQGQHAVRFDTKHRRKDGDLVDLEVSINFSQEKGGRFITFLRDITERKRAQQALEQAATEWSAAMDASEDIIYLLDTQRRIMRANRAFYAMTRSTPGKAIGHHIVELVHPRGERVPCPVCRAQENLKDLVLTMEPDHPDNPAGRPIEITVRVVKDKQGNPVSIFMNIRDLTHDRKMREDTVKLEEQLRQSQKMESIGTLAGGIAHDFNNILTAIIGYGNIVLMKMAKDDPQRLNVEHMLDAGDRAAHLTKDLLLFSRKQISERKPADLNEIIRKVEKFLKRVIGEDIECRTSLGSGALTVLGDAHQLEQVMMNLATNARDAMPTGGIFSITTDHVKFDTEFVSVHGFGKPGTYVLTTISDTGKGMDEATREHIFEPFFTTKEVGKGTGLGLAVVYGIIKQHEGFVNVYSEPGQGTTFKIYLPLIDAQADETKAEPEEHVTGGTESILVAEDDAVVRDMTRTVLEDFGYRVILANDGADAVNKYQENKDRIQLLLFDLVMPNKNGKEAYEEIKAVKPDIKAIFLSGYARDMITQKALLDDNAAVTQKPISPTLLLKKVREVLDRK